jgi:hypothetical protein
MNACRICLEGEGKLHQVCNCLGTQKYVHIECIQKWIHINRKSTCELCLAEYDKQLVSIPMQKETENTFISIMLGGFITSITYAWIISCICFEFKNPSPWSTLIILPASISYLFLFRCLDKLDIHRLKLFAVFIWYLIFLVSVCFVHIFTGVLFNWNMIFAHLSNTFICLIFVIIYLKS